MKYNNNNNYYYYLLPSQQPEVQLREDHNTPKENKQDSMKQRQND